ncbi:hypothetical protein OBBRIDRAFT_625239 [Obba rivulosa]|uniref:Protein kinase domain-containing protein n=1 Tax=Obba rivulosa TaxID=1052685 RepID=A0A8E2AT59_9APHY|nr:hypothetical protein OBBRIDRAFT_625239 [Obba rivulosa]
MMLGARARSERIGLCIEVGEHRLKTICMVALQLLVHSWGLIIRNVKPENNATRLDVDYSAIYVFNFGMARLYEDPTTKEHIPHQEGLVGVGSARYASYNAHIGRELSRRDDLEALGNSFSACLRTAFHGRVSVLRASK